MKTTEIRGTLLVTLSGLLYGFMGYFGTQLIHQHFSLPAMLFWRFFIAMWWVGLSALVTRKNIFADLNHSSTLLRTVLISGISYSGASALFFVASQYTGTGIAMVIFFCFPVFVTLFTWATTHWQMNRYTATSLVAIVVGLFLLKGRHTHAVTLTGIAWAVGSGISYAIYVLSSKQIMNKNINSSLLTFLVCLGTSLTFFILAVCTHSFFIPSSLTTWCYIIAFGVIATAIPIQLLLEGIKYISSIKASILSVLEPVMTLLVGVVLLDESMSVWQTVGVAIVLMGALFIQFEKRSEPRP